MKHFYFQISSQNHISCASCILCLDSWNYVRLDYFFFKLETSLSVKNYFRTFRIVHFFVFKSAWKMDCLTIIIGLLFIYYYLCIYNMLDTISTNIQLYQASLLSKIFLLVPLSMNSSETFWILTKMSKMYEFFKWKVKNF